MSNLKAAQGESEVDDVTPQATTNQDRKPNPAKLGAEKLTPEEQRRRFEELAREAGCDEESAARFEAAVKTIARHKPPEQAPSE